MVSVGGKEKEEILVLEVGVEFRNCKEGQPG